MNLSFVRIHASPADWRDILHRSPERTIFQTAEWLSFLAKSQQGEVVLAALKGEGRVLGYFAGLVIQRMGFKILGSPLPGWTTSYMGLNLIEQVSRRAAVQALIRFAFDELDCVHFEMMDRKLTEVDVNAMDLAHRVLAGFEVDLTRRKDELLAAMSSACRRCIRKAEKIGVTIEEANDSQFVVDYYEQLREVFGKRKLLPTYDDNRVRELISCFQETGFFLLLRARDPQGRCIATGIFPAMNGTMYFWGGASRQVSLGYRPNEALHWYAMRYWKARGMQFYDMGGGGEYKRKFGGNQIRVPWFQVSKYSALPYLREFAQHLLSWRQLAWAWVRR